MMILKNQLYAVQTSNANIKANISDLRLEAKDVKAVDVLGFLPGTDLKDEVLGFLSAL